MQTPVNHHSFVSTTSQVPSSLCGRPSPSATAKPSALDRPLHVGTSPIAHSQSSFPYRARRISSYRKINISRGPSGPCWGVGPRRDGPPGTTAHSPWEVATRVACFESVNGLTLFKSSQLEFDYKCDFIVCKYTLTNYPKLWKFGLKVSKINIFNKN